ncbi:hypothetical protein BDN72DRAFT_834574 [Pluteus cervinus]|uniref:Uncharacterized protein n=1 Tax=Pluteus cervinus TaxID=181527 RepID=A0ACD3B727_9AGAR|nr:hypothetical protein BDN72DRAFT_834574 [Pluteus cervinus]
MANVTAVTPTTPQRDDNRDLLEPPESLRYRSPTSPTSPTGLHIRTTSETTTLQLARSNRELKMPACWKVDYYLANNPGAWTTWYYKLESLLFQFLCLTAFGKAEVTAVWKDIIDPEGIKEVKEQLADHVTNTNIMSGLLLATAAVFLTTGSPREDLLSFNNSAPYACLLFSFGMAMGSILGGCALQLVAGRCTAKFFHAMTQTRLRLHMTLLLMGYPLFAVVVACNVCGAGLLIASIESVHVYVTVVACLLVALPWSLFLIFAWLSLNPVKHQIRRSVSNGKSSET